MGLDPGAQGGLAVISDVAVIDTLARETVTDQELHDWAARWAPRVRLAVIEQVAAMPKQGVSSTFKFGVSYGSLRMLLVALRVPWRTVTPAVWQRAMDCKTGGKKKITREAAQRLFPGVKATNAIADALLLAAYARRLDVMTTHPAAPIQPELKL